MRPTSLCITTKSPEKPAANEAFIQYLWPLRVIFLKNSGMAKADEPQEREKAKEGLKNAVVGFFLIFILVVVMRIITLQLVTWVNSNRNGMTEIKVNY